MVEQGQQMPPAHLFGGIPLGRGLMPDELADFKAKGREWSRLYKERRRKEFSPQQVEERKLKNRLRQKRFRERQKSREQEEAVRLATSLHPGQAAEPAHHTPPEHHAQQAFEPASLPHYGEPEPGRKLEDSDGTGMPEHHAPGQGLETLVEKRKRLGRERQARFREKKRTRGQPGTDGSAMPEGTPGLAGPSGQAPSGHDLVTLTDLQKMSAQLAGYYTGLTHGLTQEEHQAVMRFFLDHIREELGDEVFGGPGYAIADAHTAAAQAGYMVSGQPGLDLQALQAAAAAHLPQGDLQSHLQGHHQTGAVDHSHLQSHLAHQAQIAADPNHEAANEIAAAQLESYHRQLAEAQAQQGGLAGQQHQGEAYEYQQAAQKAPSPKEHGQTGGSSSGGGTGQQGMLYGQQPSVHQEMMQPGGGLHYVNSAPSHS